MGLKRLSTEGKVSITIKALAIGVLVLLLSGCGANYQISTLNYDPIYDTNGNEIEVDIINNEWELRNKLRTDFNFRYDFAQYALRQPPSFDWRFNRFNRGYNQYSIFGTNTWGYGSYWNRDMMWMDWVWGYPFGNGMGWSYSWNNQRWSSNQWGWNNPYGWNNYYGWGNGYGWNNGFYNRYRGTNVAYHNGRRTSVTNGRGSTMTIRDRIGQSSMIESTKRTNTRVREVRNSEDRVIKPNRRPNVIPNVRNNETPQKIYRRPENNSNTIRNNNSRPVRTSTPPTIRSTPIIRNQPTSTPVRRTQPTKGRGN